MYKIVDFVDNNPWVFNFLYSLLTIFCGILLYNLTTRYIINKLEAKKGHLFKGNRSRTYVKLIKNVYKYIYFFIVLFIVLDINGVNASKMAAGVGIVSIIIGFAIQDALKDIIKGIDIISDQYYQVGDVITFDKYTGKVLAVGIKTTKIEDIFSHNIVSLSNRNIEKVEVVSHLINISVPLPYELKLKKAEDTLNYILKEIEKLDGVEKVEYRGVNELGSSSINYRLMVYCAPFNREQIRRDSLTCIVKCLEEKKISIPYTQIDIHKK